MSDARAGLGQAEPATARTGRQPGGPAPRNRWRAVFFLLAITGIVVGVVWALLGSSLLVVRSVHVTGTGGLVPASEVTAAARIPLGLPLIRVDTAAVARRVERIRQVQSAQVNTDWPDAVTITVQQRRAVFAVPGAGGYGLVDPFGVTVATAARRPRALPLLSAGQPLPGSPAVRAAAAVLRELPRAISRQVRAVAAPSPDEVSVRLADGVTVVWGGPQRAAEKKRELVSLMRTHARMYNVSAPGTAVTQG